MKREQKKEMAGNRGMTYIELIVVLGIFSVLSAISIYNYSNFQSAIDLKNLSSEIALKIVEAQKNSLNGTLPSVSQQSQTSSVWKPSYGLYFNLAVSSTSFVYFTDLNQGADYTDTSFCNTAGGTGECLSKINITKNNSISAIHVYYQGDPVAYPLNDLTLVFTRPNSSPTIKSVLIPVPATTPLSYVALTLATPRGGTSLLKIYPSGRIQIN